MNRIVIIGNGFDLAHGLSSRYEDFVLHLINKVIEDLNNQEEQSTLFQQLFVIKKNPIGQLIFNPFKSIDEIKNDSRIFKIPFFSFLNDNYRNTERWTTLHTISITFNSKLFYDLFSKKNWTDVEKGYFDLLAKIFKYHNDEIADCENFIKLNQDFEKIKSLFIEYISKINIEPKCIEKKLNFHLDKCFETEDIYGQLNPSGRARQVLRRFENKQLEKVILVNFNYTNILNHYIKNHLVEKTIIQIHGETYKPKSIVFGYGDEMTEYYKKLEDLDSEEVLKHFKSHYYHSNNSYANLLYEVESHEFDVVVFGHSLGLSDRLLLNTIFENSNCKAIHLFHSGSENHFKKRIALSRHFDNKKEFRKKLIEEIDYLKIER
jgi:hypothetical protein